MAEQADMETAKFVPQEARLKIKKKNQTTNIPTR